MIQFIFPEIYRLKMNQDVVKKRAATAVHDLNIEDKGLSLKICNDREMQQLNKTYRGIDRATDVLSFPLPFVDPQSKEVYLGDIIISFPTAKKQAKEHQQTIEDELTFLFLHGLLHLLGYDHEEAAEEKAMFALQDKLFAKVIEKQNE
jgi:probable rRNA maturation factor